jgi:hypothetical protein
VKYITAAAFLCILIFSTAYSQQVIRETVAPTGVPSAGYSICWIDAGTHVLNCRNAAGETYQPGALEASGQLRVAFPGVSVLPPATSGSIRGVYVFTGAAAQNQCPLSGSGGSGGSSTALCWTDGTLWHAIPLADSNGNMPALVGDASGLTTATVVTFHGVTVLPPASTATATRIYHMTAASVANVCPAAGDSGGTATADCYTNNNVTYRALGGALTAEQKLSPTSTDPACTASGDIGKLWLDDTTPTANHFKVCADVSSTIGWQTVF